MRLICPICGAQYEVDAALIPAEGRDVQCSACGQVWFAKPGGSAGAEPKVTRPMEPAAEAMAERAATAVPAPAAGAASAGRTETSPGDRPAPAMEPAPVVQSAQVVQPAAVTPTAQDVAARGRPAAASEVEAMPVTASEPAAASVAAATSAGSEEPATLADVPPAEDDQPIARRTVTPAIAEILRAEAEREKAVRAAQAQAALERQEELDLPGADDPEYWTSGDGAAALAAAAERGEFGSGGAGTSDELAAAIKRIVAEEAKRIVADGSDGASAPSIEVPAAEVRPVEPPQDDTAHLTTASRRDRLPDIEEISSTLSPEPVASEEWAETEPRRRSGRGFRLGFALVLLLSAALAMAYVYAPRIVAEVPESRVVIEPYTEAVDKGRLWLDQQLNRFLDTLGTESGIGTEAGPETGTETDAGTEG